MSSWTDADIAAFEQDIALIPPRPNNPDRKDNTLPQVKANVGLSIEADILLDLLASKCSVGRSEIIRQLIVVGSRLLATPYADHEDACWHAVRALRAQLGDSEEYKKEYPRA